jgi:hypothetical protein
VIRAVSDESEVSETSERRSGRGFGFSLIDRVGVRMRRSLYRYQARRSLEGTRDREPVFNGGELVTSRKPITLEEGLQ